MKRLPNILIKELPYNQMRFTTAGDWLEHEDGSFEIQLCELDDWRYSFIVLIHELTEWAICQLNGVTTKEADDFDILWETELKSGLHKPEMEAGFDKRCPYRKGHIWGVRMERLFCWILGLKWKVYCETWDKFFQQ